MEARISNIGKGTDMTKDHDWVEEARRIADAEVDRATGEFRRDEAVRHPSFDYILKQIKPGWQADGTMPVLYPAGPVCGVLSVNTVEEAPHGLIRYTTYARLPREFVKLDVAKLREAGRCAAERIIRYVAEQNPEGGATHNLRCIYIALWHALKKEFSRQLSEAALVCPVKLETFTSHCHLHPKRTYGI